MRLECEQFIRWDARLIVQDLPVLYEVGSEQPTLDRKKFEPSESVSIREIVHFGNGLGPASLDPLQEAEVLNITSVPYY